MGAPFSPSIAACGSSLPWTPASWGELISWRLLLCLLRADVLKVSHAFPPVELGSEDPARAPVPSLTSSYWSPALMGVAVGAQAGGSTELSRSCSEH